MRARSYQYPDDTDHYTDTTYYHQKQQYLDVGYQRLKIFQIELYPELSTITKLFIDHNKLESLPDPKSLPCLKELNCSSNCLQKILFYPQLTSLNISHNSIIDCHAYHQSSLKYFDCSYNLGFRLNFSLPVCEQLYIDHTDLTSLNLNLIPQIRILDCGHNQLQEISSGNTLVELNIQNNQITKLCSCPRLLRLDASQNKITYLPTYPSLISIDISFNHLQKIADQPKLQKIIATNNYIQLVGQAPELQLADFSHNLIKCISLPNKIEYLSLPFNPIGQLNLNSNILASIKELRVSFGTYKYIYTHYYPYFDAIHVQPNSVKLEEMLRTLSKVFNDEVIDYIFRSFTKMKFQERAHVLFQITLKLYQYYFSRDKIKTVKELIQTKEFKYLLDNITKLYYKTIIITFYFRSNQGSLTEF